MSQLSQIEMNMIMNGKMKESIYKRLEKIGLYSYDVGNRRKWYYSNPDLQDGYVEEEKEIQVVFVDWMGSITEMWVNHDFSLHPVWYKILKNNDGRYSPRKYDLENREEMFKDIVEQVRQLDRLVIERNKRLMEDRKRRQKEEIRDCCRKWDAK